MTTNGNMTHETKEPIKIRRMKQEIQSEYNIWDHRNRESHDMKHDYDNYNIKDMKTLTW